MNCADSNPNGPLDGARHVPPITRVETILGDAWADAHLHRVLLRYQSYRR